MEKLEQKETQMSNADQESPREKKAAAFPDKAWVGWRWGLLPALILFTYVFYTYGPYSDYREKQNEQIQVVKFHQQATTVATRLNILYGPGLPHLGLEDRDITIQAFQLGVFRAGSDLLPAKVPSSHSLLPGWVVRGEDEQVQVINPFGDPVRITYVNKGFVQISMPRHCPSFEESWVLFDCTE
jgi:hypothetical protein